MIYSRGWLYLALVALSGGALLLVLVNAWLVESNRTAQAEVNQHQEFINQTVEISKIHETLVRSLAQARLRTQGQPVARAARPSRASRSTRTPTGPAGLPCPRPPGAPPAATGK